VKYWYTWKILKALTISSARTPINPVNHIIKWSKNHITFLNKQITPKKLILTSLRTLYFVQWNSCSDQSFLTWGGATPVGTENPGGGGTRLGGYNNCGLYPGGGKAVFGNDTENIKIYMWRIQALYICIHELQYWYH